MSNEKIGTNSGGSERSSTADMMQRILTNGLSERPKEIRIQIEKFLKRSPDAIEIAELLRLINRSEETPLKNLATLDQIRAIRSQASEALPGNGNGNGNGNNGNGRHGATEPLILPISDMPPLPKVSSGTNGNGNGSAILGDTSLQIDLTPERRSAMQVLGEGHFGEDVKQVAQTTLEIGAISAGSFRNLSDAVQGEVREFRNGIITPPPADEYEVPGSSLDWSELEFEGNGHEGLYQTDELDFSLNTPPEDPETKPRGRSTQSYFNEAGEPVDLVDPNEGDIINLDNVVDLSGYEDEEFVDLSRYEEAVNLEGMEADKDPTQESTPLPPIPPLPHFPEVEGTQDAFLARDLSQAPVGGNDTLEHILTGVYPGIREVFGEAQVHSKPIQPRSDEVDELLKRFINAEEAYSQNTGDLTTIRANTGKPHEVIQSGFLRQPLTIRHGAGSADRSESDLLSDDEIQILQGILNIIDKRSARVNRDRGRTALSNNIESILKNGGLSDSNYNSLISQCEKIPEISELTELTELLNEQYGIRATKDSTTQEPEPRKDELKNNLLEEDLLKINEMIGVLGTITDNKRIERANNLKRKIEDIQLKESATPEERKSIIDEFEIINNTLSSEQVDQLRESNEDLELILNLHLDIKPSVQDVKNDIESIIKADTVTSQAWMALISDLNSIYNHPTVRVYEEIYIQLTSQGWRLRPNGKRFNANVDENIHYKLVISNPFNAVFDLCTDNNFMLVPEIDGIEYDFTCRARNNENVLVDFTDSHISSQLKSREDEFNIHSPSDELKRQFESAKSNLINALKGNCNTKVIQDIVNENLSILNQCILEAKSAAENEKRKEDLEKVNKILEKALNLGCEENHDLITACREFIRNENGGNLSSSLDSINALSLKFLREGTQSENQAISSFSNLVNQIYEGESQTPRFNKQRKKLQSIINTPTHGASSEQSNLIILKSLNSLFRNEQKNMSEYLANQGVSIGSDMHKVFIGLCKPSSRNHYRGDNSYNDILTEKLQGMKDVTAFVDSLVDINNLSKYTTTELEKSLDEEYGVKVKANGKVPFFQGLKFRNDERFKQISSALKENEYVKAAARASEPINVLSNATRITHYSKKEKKRQSVSERIKNIVAKHGFNVNINGELAEGGFFARRRFKSAIKNSPDLQSELYSLRRMAEVESETEATAA